MRAPRQIWERALAETGNFKEARLHSKRALQIDTEERTGSKKIWSNLNRDAVGHPN